MSLPVISLAAEAALAHAYPQTLNRRERKIAESVKAYVDGQVTVRPAFVTVAAGTRATVAGSATQTLTISGALSSDLALVVLKTAGATPRTVLTASAGSGAVTVVMSGDPSTDHVLTYMLLRANA